MSSRIPDLIDNKGNKLNDILKDLISEAEDRAIDAVSAFLNLKGLSSLEPEIHNISKFRLLLGKSQDEEFLLGEENIIRELEDSFASLSTFPREIEKWYRFFSKDNVEVRIFRKKFVHGKAYIIKNVPHISSVGIVGSSNLTQGGLVSNLELNAVLKQESAVSQLQTWFEELWKEADDYKEQLLELLSRFTKAYKPYEIYIKVLYEALIKDKPALDFSGKADEKTSIIALADFQHDGYLAAKEILNDYGGVLIADSVGLGKTYIALKLLEDLAYHNRETALVICPAAVENTVWRPRLRDYTIPHEIVTVEKISRKGFNVDEYAKKYKVILIDESHNFRNDQTNRWENIFEIIRRNADEKKVILLTATPVNNSVFDLYNQLRLITKGDNGFLVGIGIEDLERYFKEAERNKDVLYEILEALVVRRSRHFIKKNYQEAEIDGVKVKFPERVLKTLNYSLIEVYGEDLYKEVTDLVENLHFSPYLVEIYRKDVQSILKKLNVEINQVPERFSDFFGEIKRSLHLTPEEYKKITLELGRQHGLTSIMRVLYLKRLESSIYAFKQSLENMLNYFEKFRKYLEEGKLLTSDIYRKLYSSQNYDELKENEVLANHEELKEISNEEYDVEKLKNDLNEDIENIRSALSKINVEKTDAKLEILKEAFLSSGLKGKKVVIFSYFKDTASYIYSRLLDADFLKKLGISEKQIALIDSDVKSEQRLEIIKRFAPKSNDAEVSLENQVQILISTDLLSEGQNLQDAEAIINYDLHWNPVRMVQRIGRVDRIGSPHEKIFVYNFFPEQELEEILKLLQRLYEKIGHINRTVGLDGSILGEMPNPLDFNTLKRVEKGDESVLDELEGESELNVGEFLYQDLLDFLKKISEKKIEEIPKGAGAVLVKEDDGETGLFASFKNPIDEMHYWVYMDLKDKNRKIEYSKLKSISKVRCSPHAEPGEIPDEIDIETSLKQLRKELWDRLRRRKHAAPKFSGLQKKIINFLQSLPSSKMRNEALEVLSEVSLDKQELRELRKIWHARSRLTSEKLLKLLSETVSNFAINKRTEKEVLGYPETPEELECIGWILVKQR